MRDDFAREGAATIAATRTVDAQVAHEGHEPRDDGASLGHVLPRAIRDGDERVVQDVLRLGTIAQDAKGDGQERRRVAIVQGADRGHVAPGDPLDELDVGRRGSVVRGALHPAPRLYAAARHVKCDSLWAMLFRTALAALVGAQLGTIAGVTPVAGDPEVARSSGWALPKSVTGRPYSPSAAPPPALLGTLVQTHTDECVILDEASLDEARFTSLLADRVTGKEEPLDGRLLGLLRRLAAEHSPRESSWSAATAAPSSTRCFARRGTTWRRTASTRLATR